MTKSAECVPSHGEGATRTPYTPWIKRRWYLFITLATVGVSAGLMIYALVTTIRSDLSGRLSSGREEDFVIAILICSVVITLLGLIWGFWSWAFFRSGDVSEKFNRTPRQLIRSLVGFAWVPTLFVLLITGIVVAMSIVDMRHGHVDWTITVIWTVIAVVFAIASGLITVAVRRRVRTLAARKQICFGCGYDLRASTATDCPECGHVAEQPAEKSPKIPA